MTFKEAFAKARKEKGPGKTFTWNGKTYTTDYASESKSSSPRRPQPKPETEGTSKTTRPRAKPRQSAASTPKVTTTSLDRNRRSDDRDQAIRRRVLKAIDRADAGASRAPTQKNTQNVSAGDRRGLHDNRGDIGKAIRGFFSRMPKANRKD